MKTRKVIQSYVYYEKECFLVSTIERNSSGIGGDNLMYYETIVWKINLENNKRGKLLYVEGDSSLKSHIDICEKLLRYGSVEMEDE